MGTPETIAPLYLDPQPIRVAPANWDSNLRFRRLCASAETIVDGVACWLGTMSSVWLAHSLYRIAGSDHWIRDASAISALAAVLVLLFLDRARTYGSGGSLLGIRETERAIRLSTQVVLLL